MNIETIIKYYQKHEKDDTVQNLIAQANSRYILYNANEPEENFPRYSSNLDERCLHIAFTYLNFGWNFFNNEEKQLAKKCIEKASEILEHLYAYPQCDKIYKDYYNLVCALGYYVVSQYSKSFIVLKTYACTTHIATMIHSLVVRNFSKLDTLISIIYLQSEGVEDTEEMDSHIYTRISANSFNCILEYIYTGKKESLDNAKQIICDLIELSAINAEPHIWWIFRLLFLIFEEYETTSLWAVLPPLITNSEIVNKYIQANIYKERPIVELFKSQRRCVENSLLHSSSFVVGMPTSSGKTKVAEIHIVDTLSKFPNALCMYLAPFRSLANEIESNLSTTLNVMGYIVSHLYGSAHATQMDRDIIDYTNIIIATPEKIKSILRSNPDLEDRVKLVIVDEGHLVGGQPRYITSELLIEELKIVLSKTEGKLILLSAVLPNLSDFSVWIGGEQGNIAQSEWRPSAQRFGELNFINHTVNLNWVGEPRTFNNKFIEPKMLAPKRTTQKGRIFPAKYFPNDKKEAVGATAVKMLSMGSVLIYVGRSNMVISQAKIIANLFKQQNITHEWKNQDDLKFVQLTCEEAYGSDSEIYSFVEQGIICHSSKLPTEVRQSIEQLMANGMPKIVVATSTLGQGVNIGVSTVIISNVLLNQTDEVEVKDFWNIVGRAGRAFADTEGKILYAIDRTKGEYSVNIEVARKNKYFQNSNIEKATSGLFLLLRELFRIAQQCEIDYEIFLELLSENTDIISFDKRADFFDKSDWLLDLLDDTLLSMNLKYNAYELNDCSDWIDEAFRGSLAYLQASSNEMFDQNKVIAVLKARNKGVVKIVGHPDKWAVLCSSSIPLKTSLYLDTHIEKIIDNVSQYINSKQNFDESMKLIQYLDEFIISLPISFEKKYLELANQYPIRNAWYGGKSIDEISKIVDKADQVCSQYYGFHFPWIVNAISRKLLLLGRTEEAKVLENISLFSEIGVSDIVSARIYLTGIKSRMCSIELSELVEEVGLPIKMQLIQLKEQFESNEIQLSEKSFQWLNLLSNHSSKNERLQLSYIRIKIEHSKVKACDRLYCKFYDNRLYLCSWDYQIKLLTNQEFSNKYRSLEGVLGVYFQKTDETVWELLSENPYIMISKE